MQHSDLIKKYNKAESQFKKGNYRRAKWIFEYIVFELSASDSDSMGDVHLHNSAQSYLDEIEIKKLSGNRNGWILLVLILVILLYITYIILVK